MGAWGTRIFDDDGASDIKTEYKILLGYGMAPEEAYQRIRDYFYKDYEGSDDEDVYWLSIALFQWQHGILLEEVKEKAIQCIDDEEYLERWKDSGKAVYEKRKKVLEEFRERLLHEVNPIKKVGKCPKYYRQKTKWKVGDLLAYRIMTEPSEWGGEGMRKELMTQTDRMLYKKYVLLRVVEVTENPVTLLCPELDYTSTATVMLYDWLGEEIPSLELIPALRFRPVVVIRQFGKCEIASGVALEWEDTKKEREICEITLLGNDPTFVERKPELFLKNSDCPLKFSSQFGISLVKTFAPFQDEKVIWCYGKEEYTGTE